MFVRIFRLLKGFPSWLQANKTNKLIFIRFLLLLLNFTIFAAAVIWVVLQFKGKI
ncbi:MAG: hypothetical protein ABIH82_00165 [Candidatus Woesearchaeota archaeon]